MASIKLSKLSSSRNPEESLIKNYSIKSKHEKKMSTYFQQDYSPVRNEVKRVRLEAHTIQHAPKVD